MQDGPVDLCHGCRGERLAVEGGEDLLQRAAVVLGQELLDQVGFGGRDGVLQVGERSGDVVGKEAGPGGEDLAGFDEQGSGLGEAVTQGFPERRAARAARAAGERQAVPGRQVCQMAVAAAAANPAVQ
ncbi:hypothetical protein [Streptomyces sp. WAC 04229]|uniref:hypothetical protein n=1 Tax=Streptomyces sp. WAC 04229 TaxID=2203206 RepID=UPI003D7208BA